MYTCCPGCGTWFRVTEAQLGIARAWVRCGQCLESFDASGRLWSAPDEASARVPWRMDREPAEAAAAPEPESEPVSAPPPVEDISQELPEPLAGVPEETPAGDDRALPSAASLDDIGIEVALDSDRGGPRVGDVRRVSTEELQERRGPDRIHEGRVAARRRRSREQEILNRIEGLDGRRRRRWAANSSIVLLLLLVLQYAWFMAGDLAATFPSFAPALDEFCAVTGCETSRRSSDDGIRVVSRAVRPHGEYTSALSVKATLENRSLEVRPFPVVVFVLYGKDGRAVASRAFEPAEYLRGGPPLAEGLESGNQVDIAFNLVTPSKVWVSFDLRPI